MHYSCFKNMSEEDVCLYCKKQKCLEDCHSIQKSICRLIKPMENESNIKHCVVAKSNVILFYDYQGWTIMQAVYPEHK